MASLAAAALSLGFVSATGVAKADWSGTGSVVTTIPLTLGHSWGVAYADSKVWVAANIDGYTMVVDTASNTSVNAIDMDVLGRGPNELASTPDGTRIWVTANTSDRVEVLSASEVVLFSVAVGHGPTGIAISPDGTQAYVTNWTDGTVSVIDTATHAVTRTITVGTQPRGVAFSPDGSRAYVANSGSNSVSVINVTTGQVTATVSVGASPIGLAVSPDNSSLWVANYSAGTVSVVNTTTLAVTSTLNVGAGAAYVLFAPDGSRAWVALSIANAVAVVDVPTLATIGTIATGRQPLVIARNPDGSRIYVSLYLDNSLAVIDTALGSAPAGDPSQFPRVAPQAFAVPAGTLASECGNRAPSWVDWPGIASLHASGWGVSYASWPNGNTGGWVCSRQPTYDGSHWIVG